MDAIPEHLAKLAVEICGDAIRVPWSEIKEALDDIDQNIEDIRLDIEMRNQLNQRKGWPLIQDTIREPTEEDYRKCVLRECEKHCGNRRLGVWSLGTLNLEEYAVELCGGCEDKVPWSEIKMELDELSKNARKIRREIAEKHRELKRTGKPYEGGGLLELCRVGVGDYYVCVREVCKRHVKLPDGYATPEHSDCE